MNPPAPQPSELRVVLDRVIQPSDVLPFALEANKAHQSALTEHAQSLTDELKELDKLLHLAERAEELDNDQVQMSIQLSGTKKAFGLVSSNALAQPDSPFASEAAERMQYLQLTTPRTWKPRELDLFDDAVRDANKRAQALDIRENGTSSIDIDTNTEGIDWSFVAEKMGDILSNKCTPEECRYKWLHDRHPNINKKEWTPAEVTNLRLIIDHLGRPINWLDVATELQTNRLPADCLRKHQQNQHRTAYKWSSVEEGRLQEAVVMYGEGNWGLVARYVAEDVTALHCETRYNRLVSTSANKGPWTAEEDARLDETIKAWGQAWTDVAAVLGSGRSHDQCRERFLERKKAASQPWTDGEDLHLLSAHRYHGDNWPMLAAILNTKRTEADVRSRFIKLNSTRMAQRAYHMQVPPMPPPGTVEFIDVPYVRPPVPVPPLRPPPTTSQPQPQPQPVPPAPLPATQAEAAPSQRREAEKPTATPKSTPAQGSQQGQPSSLPLSSRRAQWNYLYPEVAFGQQAPSQPVGQANIQQPGNSAPMQIQWQHHWSHGPEGDSQPGAIPVPESPMEPITGTGDFIAGSPNPVDVPVNSSAGPSNAQPATPANSHEEEVAESSRPSQASSEPAIQPTTRPRPRMLGRTSTVTAPVAGPSNSQAFDTVDNRVAERHEEEESDLSEPPVVVVPTSTRRGRSKPSAKPARATRRGQKDVEMAGTGHDPSPPAPARKRRATKKRTTRDSDEDVEMGSGEEEPVAAPARTSQRGVAKRASARLAKSSKTANDQPGQTESEEAEPVQAPATRGKGKPRKKAP
ncbi:hypothetical protein CYLTODRAFT_417506 [Cylindrobasidium torrendii FP15055 ss-10]|uniref:Uncharacterized protein n=1 Tax=Cylindrobasidium torrendii FP15055 ss-10 TaxID=1314674 RepID=A0A0D7BRX0_9AGAR|nr:hypothetical protein CYLTODRAFT_417506 [Cylindrobasidium torrendii FP15055 ss-10]